VRFLPRGFLPYALLARFDRPIGSWLLFLPGLWSISMAARNPYSWVWLIALFGIGSVVMRGAGCVINDIWDRKMDALVERTRGRPLASGALSTTDALIFLALLCAIGFVILVLLNDTAKILGILSLLPVALYPLAKRVTWWPQIVLGLVFGWAAPMGYAAAAGHLGWPALPLYLAAILWILGYDTIYAHQDREDDALIGVKSTARLFEHNSATLLLWSYGGMLVLLAISMFWAHLHIWGILALALPGFMLMRQIALLDIDDPAVCLRLFKSNREVGLAVGLAILIGQA